MIFLAICIAIVAPFIFIRPPPPQHDAAIPATTPVGIGVSYDVVVKGFNADFIFEQLPQRLNRRPQFVGRNLIEESTAVLVIGDKPSVALAHVAAEVSDPMRQFLADPSADIPDIDRRRAERRYGYMLMLIRNVSPAPQPVEAWLQEALRTHPEKSREATFRDGTLLWALERMEAQPTIWKLSVMQR